MDIEEAGKDDKRTRRRGGNKGTPQGGVISPLLANICMRRFLKAWDNRGNEEKHASRIVSYADDFVIMCRRNAEEALMEARSILTRLGLALNENKTRVCRVWKEPFDFLGYTFGIQYSFGSGAKYLAACPSKKSTKQIKEKLRRMTGSHMTRQSAENVVRDVNRVMYGWLNYFSYGSLWKTYSKLERFLQRRLRGYLVRKHKVDGRGECRFPASYIYEELGLVNIGTVLSTAKASAEPDPRAGCGKTARPVRRAGCGNGVWTS